MLSEQTRLIKVLGGGGQGMNSRKADRQRGRGVRWRDFLLRGSLTLTMEPQPVTRIALSSSVSCPLCPPHCLFPFLAVSLFHSSCIFLYLSCLVSLRARSECSLLSVAAKMYHHLSAAAHPPLTSRLLFFQTSGFKKSTAY